MQVIGAVSLFFCGVLIFLKVRNTTAKEKAYKQTWMWKEYQKENRLYQVELLKKNPTYWEEEADAQLEVNGKILLDEDIDGKILRAKYLFRSKGEKDLWELFIIDNGYIRVVYVDTKVLNAIGPEKQKFSVF